MSETETIRDLFCNGQPVARPSGSKEVLWMEPTFIGVRIEPHEDGRKILIISVSGAEHRAILSAEAAQRLAADLSDGTAA